MADNQQEHPGGNGGQAQGRGGQDQVALVDQREYGQCGRPHGEARHFDRAAGTLAQPQCTHYQCRGS
jgi:hypothetical protein